MEDESETVAGGRAASAAVSERAESASPALPVATDVHTDMPAAASNVYSAASESQEQNTSSCLRTEC